LHAEGAVGRNPEPHGCNEVKDGQYRCFLKRGKRNETMTSQGHAAMLQVVSYDGGGTWLRSYYGTYYSYIGRSSKSQDTQPYFVLGH